jgi:hypothetical protein
MTKDSAEMSASSLGSTGHHFDYAIKSHPTLYKGTMFRSRLEARWAAFFDLAGWEWQYEPIDLMGWTPDFYVRFHCGHSECDGYHDLLVEVKPYFAIDQFRGHQCMRYEWGCRYDCEGNEIRIPAHASAAFGISPRVTYWCMGHGAGGGDESVKKWVIGNVDRLWAEAGNVVQWKPTRRR